MQKTIVRCYEQYTCQYWRVVNEATQLGIFLKIRVSTVECSEASVLNARLGCCGAIPEKLECQEHSSFLHSFILQDAIC